MTTSSIGISLVTLLMTAGTVYSQTLVDGADTPGAPIYPTSAPVFNEERILGVIPDYQTVTDPNGTAKPLSGKQKWQLAWKETIDPFNIATAAMTAASSQAGNETPKYGNGGQAFGKRFGAAIADFSTQSFFSAGVLANLLHEDPRYFRKGPGTSIPSRALYSISRIVITRSDSGKPVFNGAGLGGMALGIAASNLYYPSASIHGSVMASRVNTSLFGSLTGNLMSEFWPDIQQKFLHKKHK